MNSTQYRVKAMDETVAFGMQRLLEKGEALKILSGWNVCFNPDHFAGYAQWVLALTEDRLYAAANASRSKRGFEVGNHWARSLSTITEWNFVKQKDSAGRLLGYRFVLAPGVGLEGGEFSAPPSHAVRFIEVFETSVARHRAVSATVDVAGQITAMHQLWSEGVLSDDEYNRAKELFIGRSPDNRETAEKNLRSLKQLRDTGIITDAEFAAKKWEILSE